MVQDLRGIINRNDVIQGRWHGHSPSDFIDIPISHSYPSISTLVFLDRNSSLTISLDYLFSILYFNELSCRPTTLLQGVMSALEACNLFVGASFYVKWDHSEKQVPLVPVFINRVCGIVADVQVAATSEPVE